MRKGHTETMLAHLESAPHSKMTISNSIPTMSLEDVIERNQTGRTGACMYLCVSVLFGKRR
jgi:hypothetical protein